MCMCFRQETSRDSASVGYVWKILDSIIGSLVFREALVICITQWWKFPNRSQTVPNDAETEFRKRIEPAKETGHV